MTKIKGSLLHAKKLQGLQQFGGRIDSAYLCLHKRESMKATGIQFVHSRCKRAQGPSWWALSFVRKNPTSRVTVFMDGTLAVFPLTWEVFFNLGGGDRISVGLVIRRQAAG